jgi:hypothetical protein
MCRYDSPNQPLRVNASAQEPDGAANGTWVGFALSAGDLVGTVLELRVGAAARILEGAAVGPGLGQRAIQRSTKTCLVELKRDAHCQKHEPEPPKNLSLQMLEPPTVER